MVAASHELILVFVIELLLLPEDLSVQFLDFIADLALT